MVDEITPAGGSGIGTVDINDEMSKSFVDYAMSVIVSRALPDVRDGLKPVQRRIIYAMDDMGVRPGGGHRKSATVVGEVIGKYHPHSNDAIYDALVRMGQDFSLRYPLIDPQGNFGTIDDPPAAMRYCLVGETRLRTQDGTIRMDSITDAAANSEVDIDLKVLDRHGDPVRATKLFHSGSHPTLTVKTREGFEITGTRNHPLLVLTEIEGVPLLQWGLLEEIRRTDRVVVHRDDSVGSNAVTKPVLLSRTLADPDIRGVAEQIVAEGYYYATVESVSDAGVQPVYSIRVDSEDHSFLAGGFINHNTECRMDQLAAVLLDGIDEDTVEFEDNYDGTEQQPSVLPARLPNLLVNGSQGIAVGMATNIPPYNLREIIEACLFGLENPDARAEEYLKIVKGPDFPTGAYIVGTKGVKEAMLSGRGSVKMRAVTDVEEIRKGRTAIIVRELPYQISQDRVLEKIAALVNDKKITGIADLRNESSSRVGTRLVIELKRDAVPQVVVNQLFKMTQLQDSFGVNAVALVDGVPRTLSVAEMIQYYLDHQMEVIERRTQFRLDKAEGRAHILEGLIIAVDNIDEVIKVIRGSADTDTAREALMERFEFAEIQARAILDMPLRRLTSLETTKLRDEFAELQVLIAELKAILADPGKRREIIADELGEVLEKHGDKRLSRIIPDEGDLSLEDLIADDELIVTVSSNGYLKSVVASTYRSQGRGGRGVKAAEVREDDVLNHVLHTTAHAYLLFFTNTGRVHRLKAHEIPRQARTAKGVLAQSVLPLEPDEVIEAIVDTRDYETSKYLVMITKHGQAKKTAFLEYDSRNSTLVAINLSDGDEVVAVRQTSGGEDMLLFTRQGQGIRFSEADLRPMGRSTQGVRGIKLRQGDEVVSAAASGDAAEVLLLTTSGYGKRTSMEQFPLQRRGGMGVKAIKLTRVRGTLVGATAIEAGSEIFVISSDGIVIRMQTDTISRQKRDASGVRVMNLPKGAELTSFAPVPSEED